MYEECSHKNCYTDLLSAHLNSIATTWLWPCVICLIFYWSVIKATYIQTTCINDKTIQVSPYFKTLFPVFEKKQNRSRYGASFQDKLPTATRLNHTDDSLYMLTFIVCGVLGAVLVSAVALYFAKKQAKLREKLHKFVPGEKDPSKDYQVSYAESFYGSSLFRFQFLILY